MVLFRGRQHESVITHRFRSVRARFAFSADNEMYTARVFANAERAVDLFHALAGHLPPAVDVHVWDVRSNQRWSGTALALADARDAFARLRTPLSIFAGVEFTLVGPDDQLSLSASLEVHVHARSDRWYYLLVGTGLLPGDPLPPRTWRLAPHEFPPAQEMQGALDRAIQRLGLTSE
ncbi:MAG TPA: hypothetical protein VJ717_02650 [Gemmatimonadaceae bacterium]|nr:hypothetical protein [Gemmatimonadaceae bacterium]